MVKRKLFLHLSLLGVAMQSCIGFAATAPQFVIVSAITDKRCGGACLEGALKPIVLVTILDPIGSQTCQGKTGQSFSPPYPSDSEQLGPTDVTPVLGLTDCKFQIKMFDVAVIGQTSGHYQPIKLEQLTDKAQIKNADDVVRDSKAIDKMLDLKFHNEPPNHVRYSVEQLTQQPPTVYRYEGVQPELLLLDYPIAGLQQSGPTFVLWKKKAWPITDICRGTKAAFRLDGVNYLQIGSVDCCECDLAGELRFYALGDGVLSLVQKL